MKYIRYVLYGALFIVGLMLWNAWQQEHITSPTLQTSTTQTVNQQNPITYQPPKNEVKKEAKIVASQQPKQVPQDRVIQVKTDVLNIEIDKQGGNIIQVSLPKYPETIKSTQPFLLLNDQPNTYYIARSGLITGDTITTRQENINYQASQKSFELGKDQKQLIIQLNGITANGLSVVKTFTVKKGLYDIPVSVQIKNNSGKEWNGHYVMQMNRTEKVTKSNGMFGLHSILEVAYSTPDKPYSKITLKKLAEHPISQNVKNGWVAMMQHYFLGVWIPNPDDTYHYFSTVSADGIYSVGLISPSINLDPSQSTTVTSQFYAGPKIASRLETLAPHLALAVDYSSFAIFQILAGILFWILKHINDVVGNWGWSIIILTILIKIVFYHPSAVSYRSMAAMRKLSPKMNALKEKYGKDKQAMSKAVMELYKKEKINPLGGCLPILIQIPVFLALYWVLLESVELRQSPFIFWIHDLSTKDPYYILPVLMGISMFIQQKLSPAPPDPTQAKIMMFLPVLMTVFFLNFPAGLVLYWFVNNALSILQQWYIMRKYENGDYNKKRSKK